MSNDYHTFECPHCYQTCMVYNSEIACAIFRHGIFKETYMQIDPHLCKNECEKLVIEAELKRF